MPGPNHADATGQQLHVDLRIKEPVRVASTANVTLTAPGASIDGVSLSNGDRILLKNQSTGSQNGVYVFNGSASTATRATDADAAADFVSGFKVYVREGTVNAASYWTYTTNGAITLGSTSLAFRQDATGGLASEINGLDFAPAGLTGATLATRYVGGVNGAPPSTGTFAVGDFVIDRGGYGGFVCLIAGSPGTWEQFGSQQSGVLIVAGATTISGALSVFNTALLADAVTIRGSGTVFDGQGVAFKSLTELTTIAAAATTTTAIQIPAGAIVFAVNVRVTVAIPTAATFTVIGNTTTTAFHTAAVSTAANSTDKGTAAGAFYNASAQTIRITPNLTPANNNGRVRVSVFFLESIPPTS